MIRPAKEIKGDLLVYADREKEFDVIIQGCNCFHTQGAGIAGQISRKYPAALAADKTSAYGSYAKLGDWTCARINRQDGTQFLLINMYTQFEYGQKYKGHVLVDYEAVKKGFKAIKKHFGDRRIGYPKIGSDLAGGDWTKLAKIINKELNGTNHTLVHFDPSHK